MTPIKIIEDNNLSTTWAKAFLHAMEMPGGRISNLIVRISGFKDSIVQENISIRDMLQRALGSRRESSVDTVAGTIFPYSQWNKKERKELLFERYEKSWPIIKQCPANRNGTYFRRFTSFDNGKEEPVNQLKHVIETWKKKKNHRHSALQLAVFDPRRDHSNSRRLGFPCLHQVDFVPLGSNGEDGLAITGFYATQHLFNKAYGNYLGLCRLGEFVAKELNLELKQMICIASIASIGKGSKSEHKELEINLRGLLKDQ